MINISYLKKCLLEHVKNMLTNDTARRGKPHKTKRAAHNAMINMQTYDDICDLGNTKFLVQSAIRHGIPGTLEGPNPGDSYCIDQQGLVNSFLEQYPKIEPSTEDDYGIIRYELLRTIAAYLDILAARNSFDVTKEQALTSSLFTLLEAGQTTVKPTERRTSTKQKMLLEKLIAEYFAEKKQTLKQRTIEEYKESLAKFIALSPVKHIEDFDNKSAIAVRNDLVKLPAHSSKLPKYRNKTVQELLAMQVPEHERITLRTANNIIANIKAFFTWACDMGYCASNHFDRKQFRERKVAGSARDSFTPEDVGKIFGPNSPIMGNVQPYCFWITILALYTGARQKELLQLTIDDISNVSGHLCLSITDTECKELKTSASKRILPIHPFIADALGFRAYVASCKGSGQDSLWGFKNDNWQRRYVRWYNALIKSVGVHVTNKKVFHSFRNTINTVLINAEADGELIRIYCGHKTRTMTHYYGSTKVETLASNILPKINFQVDLNHLRHAKCAMPQVL